VRRGVPLEDFFVAATGREAKGADYDRFTDAYRAHYLPGCVTRTRPFPGVVETLEALRALPTRPRLGVATTKRTDTAARVLEGTGLLPFIDVVCGSDDLPHKPHPAILHRTAERAAVPLAHGLMVGDTDRDVGAARNAGIAVAGVTWGGFDAHEMRRLAPDWTLDRMADLLDVVRGAARPLL
jgi:phosphoglycolate phosphatase-like HAD superfamily hydrolase